MLNIDGVEIHVEGTGPTVVMLHGWPDTYRLWDGTVAALKDTHRCVRFTLPGFERSHEHRAWPFEELMAFIGKVVDAVAPDEKVTLLLHDWGCVFGYNWYARNPERVARVVGVDIGDTVSFRKHAGLGVALAVFSYQTTLAIAWALGTPRGDGIVRRVAKGMRCPSDYGLMNAGMTYPYWMTWYGRPTYRGALREFDPACPMLYIYARKKPFMFHAPEWLERIRARPGNAVEEFATGHWVMLAEPERFHRTVKDWLAATQG